MIIKFYWLLGKFDYNSMLKTEDQFKTVKNILINLIKPFLLEDSLGLLEYDMKDLYSMLCWLTVQRYRVLDLFSGMGGFSRGFSEVGFDTTGVDIKEEAGRTYSQLTGGKFLRTDLHNNTVDGDEYDIIIGGPPCRPWSSINVTRRGERHPDYSLVSTFLSHILMHKPKMFLMENVPPLGNDAIFKQLVNTTRSIGYSVGKLKSTYSDFGASVRRTRLLVAGTLDSDINSFFWLLNTHKKSFSTVRDAIYDLRDVSYGERRDHVWPHLNTIEKYKRYYETGKYGWRILDWEEPSPSFGNVMKTYTLHPDSSFERGDYRTISVLEASRIMGFPKDFEFPVGIPIGKRYQMIVDSVSPDFSRVVAVSLINFLEEDFESVYKKVKSRV